jgi:hypothetical protein
LTPEVARRVERVRVCLVTRRRLLNDSEFLRVEGAWRSFLAFAARTRGLGLPLVPIMMFVDCMFPRLTMSDLIAARAAWYGKPFRKTDEALDGGVRPHPVPTGFRPGKRIGETFVALGACTDRDVRAVVRLQARIEHACGARLLLGTLLVLTQRLRADAYIQGLALHFGVPYARGDIATLDRIKRAFLRFRRSARTEA